MAKASDSDSTLDDTSASSNPAEGDAGAEEGVAEAAACGRIEAEERRLQFQLPSVTKPDVYGQCHPLESPELIAGSLVRVEEELKSLPERVRNGWDEACERCPSLVGDDHKLMFLRCQGFHADRAALRLARYWNKRIELFGEERAFLPMTLKGALRDDIDALIFGFVRINSRMVDAHGRRIVFFDPSMLDHEYDRPSMNRATWYVVHAALEDEMTQKRGIVMIIYPQKAKMKQFDTKLLGVDIENIKGCIPVRVGGFHVCHPPLYAHVTIPVIKLIIGPKLSSRFYTHSGKKDKVMKKLEKTFGIPKKSIPRDLGGHLVLDQDQWLGHRRVVGG
uniref:CRAL-TRIO domain-containing protein n=1 Tax=Pseudictyota dubia TaxID=2749911 RepID=A0A7R9ZA46_9STRA|mmetsp:Transcript_35721/g.65753  ORF Transcript_35721/g.65753 Transcript_35721/m.65753 type:complete len:334 (+) Transcript_35721:115-1116(+)